jgi:hypothetical protein
MRLPPIIMPGLVRRFGRSMLDGVGESAENTGRAGVCISHRLKCIISIEIFYPKGNDHAQEDRVLC